MAQTLLIKPTMNAKAPVTILLSILLTAHCVFLSACQKNPQASVNPAVSGGINPPLTGGGGSGGGGGGSGGSNPGGTSDGSGGNGVNNMAYEGFAVDPIHLPAYKEILKPIFDNWNKKIEEHENKIKSADKAETKEPPRDNKSVGMEITLKTKTWLIAPIALKPLNKETLGVSFSTDSTEQLAIQTDKEIWIDANKFEKMDTKAQAALIMHEYVMSLYFWKFKKINDICKLSADITGKKTCDGDNQEMEALFPAQPLKRLDDSDYQNIRRVSSWFLISGATASLDEIEIKFLSNDFDARFLASHQKKESRNDSILISSKSSHLFKTVELTNNSFKNCHHINANKTEPCRVSTSSINKIITNGTRTAISLLQLNLETESGIKISTDMEDFEYNQRSYRLSGYKQAPMELYKISFAPHLFLNNKPISVGSKVFLVDLILQKDGGYSPADDNSPTKVDLVGFLIYPAVFSPSSDKLCDLISTNEEAFIVYNNPLVKEAAADYASTLLKHPRRGTQRPCQ